MLSKDCRCEFAPCGYSLCLVSVALQLLIAPSPLLYLGINTRICHRISYTKGHLKSNAMWPDNFHNDYVDDLGARYSCMNDFIIMMMGWCAVSIRIIVELSLVLFDGIYARPWSSLISVDANDVTVH